VVDCTGLNQPESVNKVLKMTEEPFFCWINADDIYKYNFIGTHLQAFYDPAVDIVYSDCEIFWDGENNQNPYIARAKDLQRTIEAGDNPIYHPTTMIRRSLFDRIGTFNEKIKYPFDFEFWCRALKSGAGFCHIPEITARFRNRDDNLSHTKLDEIYPEIFAIRREYRLGGKQ